VRRKTALPDEQKLKKVIDERSLYARPFPLTTTIEAVHATFTDAGAKVNCVRLRRHKVCLRVPCCGWSCLVTSAWGLVMSGWNHVELAA
jgi:hypothetical protein